MKKNITIKSNINKTVKIQYLVQNPNLFENLFKNNSEEVKSKKKPTLKRVGKLL